MSAPGQTKKVAYQQGLQELRRILGVALNNDAFTEPVDWSMALPLAKVHHVDAFLFDALAVKAVATSTLDNSSFMAWRKLYLQRVIAAERTQRQLVSLLQAFKAHSLDVIPLKGSWLADFAYQDIAHRVMSDIDLLVKPEQISGIRQVMSALGYTPRDNYSPGEWNKGQAFSHPDLMRPIEIKWQISHVTHGKLPSQHSQRLWQGAIDGAVAGNQFLILHPLTHLIYICYHIMAHQWRAPLRSWLDIVMLSRKLADDYPVEQLEAEAALWGMDFRASFIFSAAHYICGVEPPAQWCNLGAEKLCSCQLQLDAMLDQSLFKNIATGLTSTRLLCQLKSSPWYGKPVAALKAVCVTPAFLRSRYPDAVQQGGLAGGYIVRIKDLIQRRLSDIFPDKQKQETVINTHCDMQARLQLEEWLNQQETTLQR